MQFEQFLQALELYERKLDRIIEEIDNDEPPEIWKMSARQHVHEIIELIGDVTHWNDYAQRIASEFGDGKAISRDEVQSILVILRTAMTRFRRRPEMFNQEEVMPAVPQFGELQFTEAIAQPTPKILQTSTGEFQLNAEPTATDTVIQLRLLMRRVLALEYILKQRPTDIAGIGHNRPPPDEESAAQDVEHELAEIEVFIAALKDQPPRPTVRPEALAQQVAKAGKISTKLLGYFDKFADKAAEAAGEEFGRRAMQLPFWYTVALALANVASAAASWLQSMPH